MANLKILSERHNLISETRFHAKSAVFILKRKAENTFSSIRKFPKTRFLQAAPVISLSESELWNQDDNDQNWILTAGKVQNLRLAVRHLNGVEVQANQVFSFWKHLGNPNIGRGYVIGREIREGCIVPTIAGGLCQLSNALYDAALKANFEIMERHRHTKVIKGSLAEQDRDATVKWNYVDFRFRSQHAFRIEAELSAEKLIVKFKSTEKKEWAEQNPSSVLFQSSKLNDCYSCGNFKCFKHPDKATVPTPRAVTTFIIDDKWPEYDDYIKSVAAEKDSFIFSKTMPFATRQRAVGIRLASKTGRNIFAATLKLDKKVASAMAGHIPLQTTHLVVSQNLLPFLWEKGVLGGRSFDVLMTRLPMEKLHERLGFALGKYPHSKTLNDFRAPQSLIDLENQALTKARHIITPHHEIANLFNNKSVRLQWALPKISAAVSAKGKKILFPASGLSRKGAYEVRRLAKDLNLHIVYTGNAVEEPGFWNGIPAEKAAGNPFDDIGLVIYPAYVEHQPRNLLKAIAAGIPVVASTATGLADGENVTIFPMGDYEQLKRKVIALLN